MCSHYTALKELERYRRRFGVEINLEDFLADVWPGRKAPFIRRADPVEGSLDVSIGMFGMVPQWAENKLARSTYNSRSETSATKPSFRNAWKNKQTCIIPVAHFFEPNYESGKAVPWRIGSADGEPLGLAGLWDKKRMPDKSEQLSFTMLTVNADHHPLMRRFHRPGDEKRSVVILDPLDYHRWLDADSDSLMSFMRLYPADLMVADAPE